MSTFLETFAGRASDDSQWTFDLDERFNGAFGGTNGGVLSAISLYVARNESGRRAASIDSRYVRGFRPGSARVVATLLNEGRTLTFMSVSIFDSDDRLCTHSTVTLAQPSALANELQHAGGATPLKNLSSWEQGRPWSQPKGLQEIPLIETFEPTFLGGQGVESITATRVIWQEADTHSEAACIAADISVGPPVSRAVRGAALTPNPDLSLRFCGTSTPGDYLTASCRLERIVEGLASTRIAVWNASDLLAIGISTTTCIPMR